MRFLRFLLVLVIILAIAIGVLRLLNPLPDLEGRSNSTRIPVSSETKLGNALITATEAHPGQSWDLVVIKADGSAQLNITNTPGIDELYPQFGGWRSFDRLKEGVPEVYRKLTM